MRTFLLLLIEIEFRFLINLEVCFKFIFLKNALLNIEFLIKKKIFIGRAFVYFKTNEIIIKVLKIERA